MNIPVANCSSCGACANVCARNAISMTLDNEGFYRPVIDSAKCISCGVCERVCPWLKQVENPNESSEKPETLAAFTKDESVREKSSSGGIFTELAEKILEDGGIVVGVAQLSSTRFGHIIVENKTDLEKLRGSKYVQANVGFIYKEIRSKLKLGIKVLFSGTPCQIAALYSVLGTKNYENLYTVDIVCHGTPSVKVFEKYIGEVERESQSVLDCINFRDKSGGWIGYALLHRFVSGKIISVDHNHSKYMRLFLSRICQNISCEECRYRKLPRIADITLGDYWGISNYHPEMDDNKGTSVVLLNTEHGKEFFNSVKEKIRYCDSKIEYAIAGNPCIIRSSKQHPKRTEFFADLDKCSFDKLMKKYRIYSESKSNLRHFLYLLNKIIRERNIKLFTSILKRSNNELS